MVSLAACASERAPQPSGPATAERADAAAQTPPDEQPREDVFTSAYTEFATENCEILSRETEEGTSAAYRCDGYGGVPLFVQEGDLRTDIDAGVANDRFETTGPYNTAENTVEWRMQRGTPFAVIFRYDVHSEIGPQRTALAVEKVGAAGSPGCRVGHVAGSFPDANMRARRLADERAQAFACGVDEPQVIGDTTLVSLGG